MEGARKASAMEASESFRWGGGGEMHARSGENDGRGVRRVFQSAESGEAVVDGGGSTALQSGGA